MILQVVVSIFLEKSPPCGVAVIAAWYKSSFSFPKVNEKTGSRWNSLIVVLEIMLAGGLQETVPSLLHATAIDARQFYPIGWIKISERSRDRS